ncbi:MAG: hypothetical protein KDA25_08640 [Phycisphaerales bacterium]|nr:hypothetical protein [Phycisphaerales bacterium]
MRTDHYAFQRATRVASFGLLIQTIGIGLLLLVTGRWLHDTAIQFASYYVLYGGFVWLSLVVLFQQHKQERLEALEHDEFSREGFEAGSAFDRADDTRVAAKRLDRLYRWVMPAASLFLASLLGLTAWRMLSWLGALETDLDATGAFEMTDARGWMLAICLAGAALSFIFSRFVAGMAKQPVWQNLRAGAGYMVGNSLVLLAVAVGIICRFFDRDGVLYAIAYAIPIFMIFVALEIVLNSILLLYRPRIPGEAPRPAFDSRILSLFAAPDNLVRSINEAVNYQFGFDVTSSWGYQLLLRSFGRLVVFGFVVIVLLNMIVIVEPHEQAIRLNGGRLVDDAPHGSGPMFKWPWPFQSVEVYDVSRVREIRLTAQRLGRDELDLWEDELRSDVDFEPFVVVSPALDLTAAPLRDRKDDGIAKVDDEFALVDAEIFVQYRIKENGGLLDYLTFASDEFNRRDRLTMRERALKVLALREITRELSRMRLDDVLARERASMSNAIRTSVQNAYDARKAGVEVVAVNFRMLRPSGDAVTASVEIPLAHQARRQTIAMQRGKVVAELASVVGDPDVADDLLAAVEAYQAMEAADRDAPETIEARLALEQRLVEAGGELAQGLNFAESSRWTEQMQKRAQALEVIGERDTYRAAPAIYRERRTMQVLSGALASAWKYVIGIDPSRVQVDADLTMPESLLGLDLGSNESK